MSFVLVFLVCLCACVIGALCGVGGGVLIKPAMDLIGVVGVAATSFLSGCTVLAMTAYSTARSLLSGKNAIDIKHITPLALGSAAGGITGKLLFDCIGKLLPHPDMIGAVQAILLLLVSAGTLVYSINRENIRTLRLQGAAACATTGVVLGVISSFLGIGGGPINLVVLYYLFSMDTKTAAENSLFIILFSQLFSLAYTLLFGNVPHFQPLLLPLMVAGGLLGGMIGRLIRHRIDAKAIDKLFIGLLGMIIVICVYNFIKFL